MILIGVGTQKFPFDRLLSAIDTLVGQGIVTEEVFAQTGYSSYQPKHYACQSVLTPSEWEQKLDECRVLLAHGGTGTLVGGIKKGKPVIAVPRLAQYGEHVDDHQREIVSVFAEGEMVIPLEDMAALPQALSQADTFVPKPFVSGYQNIVDTLTDFLNNLSTCRK